jgi:protein-L-isoaspartate(D-aspartate) O-methyltransferase
MNSREELFEHLLKESRVLEKENVRKAFSLIDRADFLSEDYKVEAYEDYAVPIGGGQSISQPTTVAFMLELLDVHEGEHVLDIGAGSAWTTALLASMVGEGGKVEAIEIDPSLLKFGQDNISKYKFKHVSLEASVKGKIGKPGKKFDRILVSASSSELPDNLLEQLNDGGILVVPIKESIWKIKKNGKHLESKEYPGFSFVSLK